MYDDKILNKLHSLHMVLADELKRICEKYDITYFIIGGTLLGAVRHKGFIPWDDDMDFGMLREDFERFLKVCEAELDSKVFLQTDRNEKYYPFNFAKLRMVGTRVLEEFSQNADVNQGIYIDIFPIDTVPDDERKRKKQYKAFWFYRNLLWVKAGYGSQNRKKQTSFKLAKIVSFFLSIDYLKRKKYETITRYTGQNSGRVLMSDGHYGLEKETLPRTWISKVCDYQFEDRTYPGIEDYDAYLSHIYDNYLKLPPENKRNHHGRISVDFGPY